MFSNYEAFLSVLQNKLTTFFDAQKEYICCSEGCSQCCKNGVYPISEIEFLYLKYALDKLEPQMKKDISDKIAELKKMKTQEQGDREWVYGCPFLKDDRCSVYTFRPIICRTFGLPYFDKNNKIKVPFCVNNGLNYSKVYDTKTKQLSGEKFKESGCVAEPLAYNLSKEFLCNSKLAELTDMHFGEEKAMIDWF